MRAVPVIALGTGVRVQHWQHAYNEKINGRMRVALAVPVVRIYSRQAHQFPGLCVSWYFGATERLSSPLRVSDYRRS